MSAYIFSWKVKLLKYGVVIHVIHVYIWYTINNTSVTSTDNATTYSNEQYNEFKMPKFEKERWNILVYTSPPITFTHHMLTQLLHCANLHTAEVTVYFMLPFLPLQQLQLNGPPHSL